MVIMPSGTLLLQVKVMMKMIKKHKEEGTCKHHHQQQAFYL
jgi:hypothetical protein